MFNIFLDRIDAAPLQDDDFSFSFNSWVAVTVDTINEGFITIQDAFNGFNNGLVVPSKTTAEIAALAPLAPDSTIWYDTAHVPPVLVAKINGVLVQIVTAAYP